MKKTKKSLIMSVLSLVLCIAMLIGTTFAWFTDSVTSGVNTITAGNLDIDVLVGSTSIENMTNLFQTTNWEPGVISYQNFTVKNKGTLAAKIKFNLDVMDENQMTVGGYKLSQVIKVAYLDGQTFSGTRADAQALTNYASLADQSSEFNLAANGTKNIAVVLYWAPTDSDNNWNANNGKTTSDGQPLYINIAVNAVATQLTSESDSFDNQYDANATYPILAPVVDETDSATVSEAGAAVVIDTNTTVPAASTTGNIQIKTSANTENSSEEKNNYAMAKDSTLEREIKTTASTADSVTYDISYVYTEGDTSYDVSEFASVLTNVIKLSTGLKEVKVTHTHGSTTTDMTAVAGTSDANYGEDGYFYYDSTTGNLTIWSSKYSSFAISYASDFVAAVGGQGYATLAEVFAAAKSGDTITVLKDCETGSSYTMDSPLVLTAANVTLNLNGKTITTTNNFTFVIAGDNDIVKNGTIKSGERRANDGNTVTDNGPLYRGYPLVVAATSSTGSVANVQVTDVTIYGGISSGGSIKNNATNVKGAGNVTLKNCTIKEGAAYALYAQLGSTINVVSGSYSAGHSGLACLDTEEEPKNNTITITGGTFSADPSAYVASLYTATKKDSTWEVAKMQLWSAYAAESYATAVDTTKKVVTIASAEELALFANEMATGTQTSYKGYTIELTADIDLGGKLWTPIAPSDYNQPVTFKGNDHTISNMNATVVNVKNGDYYTEQGDVGLFGNVTGWTISGIVIDNATVKANSRVGGIAGQMISGSITGCTVKNSTIIAENVLIAADDGTGNAAGGIIGYFSAQNTVSMTNCTVENCIVEGYRGVGGLVGRLQNPGATYSGNTVTNTTIKADVYTGTMDYKGYSSKSIALNSAEPYFGSMIGQFMDDATNQDSSNTITNVTLSIVNK